MDWFCWFIMGGIINGGVIDGGLIMGGVIDGGLIMGGVIDGGFNSFITGGL
jgi:hypothetical protein